MFTLYIGTKRDGAKSEIVRIVGEHFSSFTIIPGEGFFRGTNEPVWLVKIATEDCPRVIETAVQIRKTLDQDGVGIEYYNRYFRCTQADPASDLTKSWNFDNIVRASALL